MLCGFPACYERRVDAVVPVTTKAVFTEVDPLGGRERISAHAQVEPFPDR